MFVFYFNYCFPLTQAVFWFCANYLFHHGQLFFICDDMLNRLGQIFLLVDLREFFFRLRVGGGGGENINKKALKMTRKKTVKLVR